MSDRGTGGTRGGDRPWYESLPDGRSWAALWSGYVRCACGAIWSMEAECPVCGEAPPKEEWVVVRDADGTEYRVPPVFNGADTSYLNFRLGLCVTSYCWHCPWSTRW